MISINPFDRREKFFVLLIAPEKISAILFAVTRDRSLSCEKFWPEFRVTQTHRWWPKTLPHWNVIVAVSPHLAYTADIPLHLQREGSSPGPLSFSQLDNLLGRAMNQEFMAYRKVAGKALQVSDLDIVLADSRIADFRMDGHKVHNPMGSKAKTIEALISMTFVRRNVYESLRVLSRRSRFFFTSLDRAQLIALKKVYEPPFSLALLESPRSSIFRMSGVATGNQIDRHEIAWSAKEFLQVFMDSWGVSEEVARDLYLSYRKNELPDVVQHSTAKEFARITERLEKFLGAHAHKSKILMTSQEEVMPISSHLPLERVSLSLILEKMGFTTGEMVWPMREYEQFSYCAPLLEFFSDQGNQEVNRWLRRRLHWLGSMNYT